MKMIDSNNKIEVSELKKMAGKMYDSLVKAVVDIKKEIMAVDAAMHADEEVLLLEKGSKQNNLWGINIYPQKSGDKMVEFDSMINLRPSQGNRSRGVDDPKIRLKIINIINKLIKK